MIPFGKWRPDQYELNSAFAGEASGVLPGANSKLAWPGLSPLSSALPTACRGAFLARTSAGTYTVFAGTATKLFKLASLTSWTDVTNTAIGAYSLAAENRWSFAQFGNFLVAAQFNDPVQVIDVDAGTEFADLGGSPPACGAVKTVGDQLFLANLLDSPNRIIWSGRNDISFWTPGTRDCDYQDFADGGSVNGITNLETGLIFQSGTIRRFLPVESRAIYQFARVENSRGLQAPDSLVTLGNVAYYRAADGFYATDGGGASLPISANQIEDWFQASADSKRVGVTAGVADPARRRIFWQFATSGNDSDVLDHCLCYDLAQDEWTHAPISASFLFSGASPAYSIDSIDALLASLGYTLETVPFSFDAQFLRGGIPALAGFDSAFKLAFFTGDNLAATIETASFQALPGRRAFIRGIAPLSDSGDVAIQVAAKERAQDSAAWGASAALNAQGICPVRSSGRIHRVRATIAAGKSWSHLQGVEPELDPEGAR